MLCDAASFWSKKKRIIRALCFLVILSSILSAASSAVAANQKENVDKFIEDWENQYGKSSYWKVETAATVGAVDSGQSHLESRFSLSEGFRSQAALHDSVKNFLRAYGSPTLNLDLLWPSFQSWLKVENGPLPPYAIGGQP